MSIRIKEALVIVGLIAFILFVSRKDVYVDIPVADIESSIADVPEVGKLDKFGAVQLKNDYHIFSNEYQELLYYGYESFMDCNKVIVVKLADGNSGDNILQAFSDERERSMEVFKSYAPEQYDMLSQAVLTQKGQYIIYIVASQPKDIYETILDCIKK